jgi:hypothetical protein
MFSYLKKTVFEGESLLSLISSNRACKIVKEFRNLPTHSKSIFTLSKPLAKMFLNKLLVEDSDLRINMTTLLEEKWFQLDQENSQSRSQCYKDVGEFELTVVRVQTITQF